MSVVGPLLREGAGARCGRLRPREGPTSVARLRGRHLLLEAGFVEDVPADLGACFARRQRPRAFALVAVAAGQIEIPVEVALLRDDLRVPQDEAVHVEEAA